MLCALDAAGVYTVIYNGWKKIIFISLGALGKIIGEVQNNWVEDFN